jgi:hypothetical protein
VQRDRPHFFRNVEWGSSQRGSAFGRFSSRVRMVLNNSREILLQRIPMENELCAARSRNATERLPGTCGTKILFDKEDATCQEASRTEHRRRCLLQSNQGVVRGEEMSCFIQEVEVFNRFPRHTQREAFAYAAKKKSISASINNQRTLHFTTCSVAPLTRGRIAA